MSSERFPTEWKPLKLKRSDFFKLAKLRQRHGPILRRGGRRVFRPTIGEDPLEARAVPLSEVYGSLDERIVYKDLLRRRKEPPDFQSSLVGGRTELGGMVADFILPDRSMIIRVQGEYWHTGLRPEAKDAAQRAVLENMGFQVVDIYDWTIRDYDLFDDFMDRLLGGVV